MKVRREKTTKSPMIHQPNFSSPEDQSAKVSNQLRRLNNDKKGKTHKLSDFCHKKLSPKLG